MHVIGWLQENDLQWGYFNISGNAQGSVTYPIAMKTTYFIVPHKYWWNGAYGGAINFTSLTGTTSTWQAEGTSGTARYLVVGVQQWGRCTNGSNTLYYPLSFSTLYYFVEHWNDINPRWCDPPCCTSTNTYITMPSSMSTDSRVWMTVFAIGI